MGQTPGPLAGAPVGLGPSGAQFTTDPLQVGVVVLANLLEDGQGMVVDYVGGGFDPADPLTNNYVLEGRMTAVRDAGVVTIVASQLSILDNGAGIAGTPSVNGNEIRIGMAAAGVTGYKHLIRLQSASLLT